VRARVRAVTATTTSWLEHACGGHGRVAPDPVTYYLARQLQERSGCAEPARDAVRGADCGALVAAIVGHLRADAGRVESLRHVVRSDQEGGSRELTDAGWRCFDRLVRRMADALDDRGRATTAVYDALVWLGLAPSPLRAERALATIAGRVGNHEYLFATSLDDWVRSNAAIPSEPAERDGGPARAGAAARIDALRGAGASFMHDVATLAPNLRTVVWRELQRDDHPNATEVARLRACAPDWLIAAHPCRPGSSDDVALLCHPELASPYRIADRAAALDHERQ
jgi:hypothetical protein